MLLDHEARQTGQGLVTIFGFTVVGHVVVAVVVVVDVEVQFGHRCCCCCCCSTLESFFLSSPFSILLKIVFHAQFSHRQKWMMDQAGSVRLDADDHRGWRLDSCFLKSFMHQSRRYLRLSKTVMYIRKDIRMDVRTDPLLEMR